MHPLHAIEIAIRGLGTKPSRTFLTLLGIAIGVAAVIAISSLGAGTRQLVTDEISGLGADVIAVQPGKDSGGFADLASTLYGETITQKDVDAVRKRENVPHALEVMPFVMVPGSVSFENETYYPQIVGGSAKFYEDMLDIHTAEGEMFGDEDIKEVASIAVIGHKVNAELFGQQSGYGQKITIGGRKFRVTGVLPKLGQVAFAQIRHGAHSEHHGTHVPPGAIPLQ